MTNKAIVDVDVYGQFMNCTLLFYFICHLKAVSEGT